MDKTENKSALTFRFFESLVTFSISKGFTA